MTHRIKEIISELFNIPIETIKLSSILFEGFGFDEVDIVEMIMDIEEEFFIEISDEEISKLKTVMNIIELVDRKISEQ